MRQHLLSLATTLSFLALAFARTAPYECVSGINYALSLFNFASNANISEAEEDYYTKTCQNTLLMTSTWAAAQLYCTPRQIIAGQNYLNTTSCEPYGYVSILGYDMAKSNLTDDFITGLQIVEYEDIADDALVFFNTSVLLSKDLADIGIKTVATWDNMMANHKNLGWANYGFWGLILATGISIRVATHICSSGSSIRDLESSSSAKKATGNIHQASHWIRTNLIIPSTFGTYHQRLFYYCTVTTRLETLIIALYYMMNIICASVGYSVFSPNLYYTTRLQSWRYFSDRCGILAYSNLPLLWIFSGRNNIFIWATGCSFSRFNIFHRHIARVAVIEAIAHSVGYTGYSLIDGGKAELYESWKENYWYMGGIATVSMCLILATSSIFLRLKRYEIFLLLHIILSFIIIIALFYHTAIFPSTEWTPYLWPLVAIWSFDRLVRILRQAYVNLHISASGLEKTNGTASYDAEADLITLTLFHLSISSLERLGESSVLVGFLDLFFVICFIWHLSCPATLTDKLQDKETKTTVKASSSITSPNSPTSQSNTSITKSTETTLIFYIRPVQGFTARLKQQCVAHPSGPLHLHLILEGPYGHYLAVEKYQTLILIAGGTGIAGVLPLLRKSSEGKSKRNIKLLWSSQHSATIASIITRERDGEFDLLREGVNLDLHVTRDDGKKKHNLGLVIQKGRPNVNQIIREEVLNSVKNGRVAIVVCGPPGMSDEARDAVHCLLKEGVSGVEFVEESFGW